MKRSSDGNVHPFFKKQKIESNANGKGGTAKSFEAKWTEVGESSKGLYPLFVMNGEDCISSERIASFDLDWTLIATNSGKQFPTNSADWKFWNEKVQPKLRELHKDGFKIVIFTNQAGIEKKKQKVGELQTKISNIMKKSAVPFQAFVCTGENHYRKPSPLMWDVMSKQYNGGITIDKEKSIYVGDAAGRPKGWTLGKKKDFSCSDRKFAANIDVPFVTPEEFFNGAKPFSKFEWGSKPPAEMMKDQQAQLGGYQTEDYYKQFCKQECELILLVGYPASGKSTFSSNHLPNYVHVNRDTLKTQTKCEQLVASSLKEGKPVVVDNTNPSKEARKCYIDIAKKTGTPVRSLYFDTPIELSKHLNMFRQNTTNGAQRRVPDVGYNVFKSKFQEPSLEEGFSEIQKVIFVPEFTNDHQKKLFMMWT